LPLRYANIEGATIKVCRTTIKVCRATIKVCRATIKDCPYIGATPLELKKETK